MWTSVGQEDVHLYLHALARNDKVNIPKQTDTYISMLEDPNTIPSLAVVIEKS